MRSDLQAVFVFFATGVNGALVPHGEFDAFDGGGWSVDGKMYYPPGSTFPVNRGGKATIEDGTVSREWQPGRDDVLYRTLKDRPNLRTRVTRHVRNPDLSIVLVPFAIFDGPLTGLTPPPYDSQSADDSILEFVISSSGPIG